MPIGHTKPGHWHQGYNLTGRPHQIYDIVVVGGLITQDPSDPRSRQMILQLDSWIPGLELVRSCRLLHFMLVSTYRIV